MWSHTDAGAGVLEVGVSGISPQECALIEVGQMFYIFSIPACSPSLGGTYDVEPETFLEV